MRFDKAIAAIAVERLRAAGVGVVVGLTGDKLTAVEEALGAPLPADLALLLRAGVPVSEPRGGRFPNWHLDPKVIIRERKEFLADMFAFDIKENEYWHPSLGSRPVDLDEATAVALAYIDQLPPLVPIFGHRFMPSSPRGDGNPVYSIHGPSDTIYYGYDLVDYLFNEFGVELPVPRPQQPKPIPYWDALFFTD